MRKIILTEYVSTDGVMEDPGGWSFQFWNDEAAKFKYDELFAADALLLGRVTYQGFAAAWPTMTGTGDFGERMNGLPKYVATTTLTDLTWNNSHAIRGNIAEAVADLKQQPGQDILVAGSADLANVLMAYDLIDEYRLMAYDLIDEYRLMVHPIVLGGGKRLFRDGSPAQQLKLVDTKTFTSGVVVLTYQPARDA
jgi:dihydrofolate reductase